MARKLFQLPPQWTGRKWLSGFRTRWAHIIKLRKVKKANAAREAPGLREECESFMAQYQELIRSLNFLPQHIVNIDETKAEPNFFHDSSLAFGTSGEVETRGTQKSVSAAKTLVTCAAASGKVWMTVKLYNEKGAASPKSRKSIQVPERTTVKRNEWEALHLRNKNGFMTLETWRLVVKKLVELMTPTRSDLPILIICDRPAVHNDLELVREMLFQNVHFIFFPHNSSHLLQPLDGAPFAIYKRNVRHFQFINRTNSAIGSLEPIDAVVSAEKTSFSANVIRAGFEKRGIWPVNIEIVRQILARELPQPQDVQTDEWTEKAIQMKTAFLDVLKQDSTIPTREVACLPEPVRIYSGYDLILFEDTKKAEAERKRVEKETKKRETLEKREETTRIREEKRRDRERIRQKTLKRKKNQSKQEDQGDEKNRHSAPSHHPPRKMRRLQLICSACSSQIGSRQSFWRCEKCEDFRLCPTCTGWIKPKKNHLETCLEKALELSVDTDAMTITQSPN